VDVLVLSEALTLSRDYKAIHFNNYTMKRHVLIVMIAAFAAFSCSDKEDEEPNLNDPLMGQWKMVALEQNGQVIDISDQSCLKDSKLNVTQTTMVLSLSAPPQEGSTNCQTETASIEWGNDNGTYYVVEEGQREPAIFALEDGQLSVDINMDEAPISLIFTK